MVIFCYVKRRELVLLLLLLLLRLLLRLCLLLLMQPLCVFDFL